MSKKLNLIGERFDKLIVVDAIEKTKSGTLWLCRCDCGNECAKLTTQLRRKTRKFGGCRICEADSRSKVHTVHGGRKQNTDGTESLYKIWKSMRARVSDKNDPYYGGKGITICDEWADYGAFREWAVSAGYVDIKGVGRGDRLSIDRIDPAKGYNPDNCRWLTGRENSRLMAISQRKSA